MATIDSLIGTRLVRITVPLEANEGQPIRRIFGLPEVEKWMREDLPKLPTEPRAAMSPPLELDDLLFNYISSKGKLVYNKTFKDLIPAQNEVWELRTYQLRIFGWFYRKDDFIAVFASPKRALKGPAAYADAQKKVLSARERLPLDEPKFVGGVIYNVVSGL